MAMRPSRLQVPQLLWNDVKVRCTFYPFGVTINEKKIQWTHVTHSGTTEEPRIVDNLLTEFDEESQISELTIPAGSNDSVAGQYECSYEGKGAAILRIVPKQEESLKYN